MTNLVVNVNVSQQVAPLPPTLQKTGAFVSQGATNTAAGAKSLLTQFSDLTPLLKGAAALSSLSWSGGNVSAVTAAPHGFQVGDTLPLTIAGAVPAGYNGTFIATITGASSFQYPLTSNPGLETTPGTYTEEDVAELVAMATTFFAQGAGQAVYVLELGPGNATDGANSLSSWIAANPGFFYGYLVPRTWDGNAAFLSLIAQFETTTSKTYFFVTTTLATYQAYTAAMKDVLALIEAPSYGAWSANALTAISWGAGSGTGLVNASTTTNHGVLPGQFFTIAGVLPAAYNGTFLALPGTTGNTLIYALASNPGAETQLGTLLASQYASAGIPATEFSLAAVFQVVLNYAPSPTNRVTPLNLAFLFGVTPFPTQGNAALLTTLRTANVNVVGTGGQGGLTEDLLVGGKTMDGKPFNYWFSVDWAQIHVQEDVTAAVIDGSNDPANPIYYNQDGINALQQVAVSTMKTGIADGLVLNPIKATTLDAQDFQNALNSDAFDGFTVVNADPFASYVAENPNDYGNGVYNGFSIEYVPLRGFDSITFNITVSQFAA